MNGSGSGSLGQTAKDAAKRLDDALGMEGKEATIKCPLTGGPDVPPHGGTCCQCSEKGDPTHSIPRSDAALEEAEKLKQELKKLADTDGTIGHPDAKVKNLFASKDAGGMFGVLVCVKPNGERVVLRAFSGTFTGTNLRGLNEDKPGSPDNWCGAIASDDPNEEERLYGELNKANTDRARALLRLKKEAPDLKQKLQAENKKFRDESGAIVKELKRIGTCKLTPEERKSLGIPDDDPLKPGSDSYQKVEDNLYKPLAAQKEKLKAAHDEYTEGLESQIKGIEAATSTDAVDQANKNLLDFLRTKRSIKNFHGEPAEMGKACCPSSQQVDARLGMCAAPKLIAAAQQLGYVPISLAEFWFGTSTTQRKCGENYESCEHCRSILGYMLCGLTKQQADLRDKLLPPEQKPEQKGGE